MIELHVFKILYVLIAILFSICLLDTDGTKLSAGEKFILSMFWPVVVVGALIVAISKKAWNLLDF